MNAKPAATLEEIGKLLAGHGTDALRVVSVPGDIQKSLGALASEVLLSRYTADKQANTLKSQRTASRGCKRCSTMASVSSPDIA